MNETKLKIQLFECYNCGKDFEEEIQYMDRRHEEKIKGICKSCISIVLGRDKLK